MTRVQNTFCIVPDAPSALNADDAGRQMIKPPMTTKQVKKAYQKKNKGPKISKAEQRRIELFEQDRIRKEFEKERNQARARAAREKKKEKEDRERMEKKKKGLPLVDVRPSQDTIARFIRVKPKSHEPESPEPESSGLRSFETESAAPVNIGPVNCEPDNYESENDEPGSAELGPSDPESHKQESPKSVDDEPGRSATESHKSGSRELESPEPETQESGGHRLEDYELEGSRPSCPSLSNIGFGDEDDHIKSQNPKEYILSDDKENLSASDTSNKKTKRDYIPSDANDENKVLGHPSPFVQEKQHPNKRRKINVASSQDREPLRIIDEIPSPRSRRLRMAVPGGRLTQSSQLGKPNNRDEFPAFDLIDDDDILEDFIRVVEDAQRCTSLRSLPTNPLHPREAEVAPAPCGKVRLAKAASPTHQRAPVTRSPAPSYAPKTPFRVSPPNRRNQATTPFPGKATATPDGGHPNPNTPGLQASRHPRAAMQFAPKFKPSSPMLAGKPRAAPPLRAPQFVKPPLPSHIKPAKPSPVLASPKQILANTLPPSTQLFVLNNLDDFLPSPSQETREIFEEPMPTASLKMPTLPPKGPNPQPVPDAFEMPFFCTQDLLLSSQDVKDIEEESLSQPKSRAVSTPTPLTRWEKKPETRPSKPNPSDQIAANPNPNPKHSNPLLRPSPKPLFTSTCREMRYKYALERSKTTAWEGIGARQKAREELDQLRTLENRRLQELLVDAEDDDMEEIKEPNFPLVGRNSDSEGRRTVPDQVPKPKEQKTSAPKPKPKPKSSYEAMLELLAKGPKENRNPNPNAGTTQKVSHGQAQGVKADPIHITIPASQETNYDWDDDDMLLRDML
ncbi:hypothetical protein GGS20DRAFT_526852 [Poronia punctata]|nr:hypothetical protein GGS20DRAFT_526852 [Poronia punctata]